MPLGGNCTLDITTYTSQVRDIRYNFAGLATAQEPVPPDVPRLGTAGEPFATRIGFEYGAPDSRLTAIDIFHGRANPADGVPVMVRRIELEATVVSVANPAACDRRLADGNYETRFTATRILESIVEKTPAAGGSWHSLPAVTFAYAGEPALHHQGQGCFVYQYLRKVANGYGAETTLLLASDGRVRGPAFTNCREWRPGDPPCEERYPDVGYSYRLVDMRLSDGHTDTGSGPQTARVLLAYSGACYDQVSAQDSTCPRPETSATYGALAGHTRVVQTWLDFDLTTPLKRRITTFHVSQALFGRIASTA